MGHQSLGQGFEVDFAEQAAPVGQGSARGCAPGRRRVGHRDPQPVGGLERHGLGDVYGRGQEPVADAAHADVVHIHGRGPGHALEMEQDAAPVPVPWRLEGAGVHGAARVGFQAGHGVPHMGDFHGARLVRGAQAEGPVSVQILAAAEPGCGKENGVVGLRGLGAPGARAGRPGPRRKRARRGQGRGQQQECGEL